MGQLLLVLLLQGGDGLPGEVLEGAGGLLGFGLGLGGGGVVVVVLLVGAAGRLGMVSKMVLFLFSF